MVERIREGYVRWLSKDNADVQTETYPIVRVEVMAVPVEPGRYTVHKFIGGKGNGKPNSYGKVYAQWEGKGKISTVFGDDKYQEMLDWCKTHKWDVREWKGGFRAFRFGKHPIRDRWAIERLRNQLEGEAMEWNSVRWNHPVFGDMRCLDLAYDLPAFIPFWEGERKEGVE